MSSKKTPTYGATGIYKLKAPWEALDGVEYTCSGIASFSSALERNEDILNNLYIAKGLTEENYRADLAMNANIIVLTSLTAPTIYVPDTYIASFPNITTIPYSHIVMSCSLGALADTLDLSFVVEQIEGAVNDALGIESTVEIHKMATRGTITPAQHQTMEAQRISRVTVSTTDRAQLKAREDEVVALSEKIRVLEDFIIESGFAVPEA